MQPWEIHPAFVQEPRWRLHSARLTPRLHKRHKGGSERATAVPGKREASLKVTMATLMLWESVCALHVWGRRQAKVRQRRGGVKKKEKMQRAALKVKTWSSAREQNRRRRIHREMRRYHTCTQKNASSVPKGIVWFNRKYNFHSVFAECSEVAADLFLLHVGNLDPLMWRWCSQKHLIISHSPKLCALHGL